MITREEVIKDLKELFLYQNDTEVEMDTEFSNQGLNSLDEVEFLMGVETKYDISISDEIANKLEKPSDYIELIMEAMNQKEEAQS